MKMNLRQCCAVLMTLAISGAFVISGCSHKNEMLDTPQGQALMRTQKIVKESGGDWNKISQDDKQYLINGPGGGTEDGAKNFLSMENARANFHPTVLTSFNKSKPASAGNSR